MGITKNRMIERHPYCSDGNCWGRCRKIEKKLRSGLTGEEKRVLLASVGLDEDDITYDITEAEINCATKRKQ